MKNLRPLEEQFTRLLDLPFAPVAVTFCAAPPPGVRKFIGQVPSSCTFWKLCATAPAGKSAFFTLPSDHYNCPVGSYTHRVELPPERSHELEQMLGLMAQIGYVRPEEIPDIPRWAESPGAIVYSRLADAPLEPHVVIFRVKPGAAMLLGEASRSIGKSSGLEPLPRPTCMAIPASATRGTTLSLGCIGNRIYTDTTEEFLYVMVRGTDLEATAGALLSTRSANDQLRIYHEDRKANLTQLDPA